MRTRCALASALLLAACAGSPAVQPTAPAAPATKRAEPLPRDIVERSRVPYYGIRQKDSARLGQDALLEELATYDLVCVGESHDEPAHHFVQLEVLRRLSARAPQAGRELGVGFEMFQVPYQQAIDAYQAFDLDEPGFLARTEWQHRWGFDFSLYRPLLELGRARGARLLALNARKELTRKIARQGLEGLTAGERETLPELDLTVAAHHAFFERAMEGHPKGGPSIDKLYAAQVVWDESMAAQAAAYLRGDDVARQILVIAGNAHCQRTAIPERVRRRVPVRTASVQIVGADQPEGAPKAFAGDAFDYDVFFSEPTDSGPES